MPRGFLTEAGPRPDFAGLYGMREHQEADYVARTEANVREADATLIIGDANSGGTRATKGFCGKHRKPCFTVPWRSGAPMPLGEIPDFLHWLGAHDVRILNVAGNRESLQPGLHEAVLHFLLAALKSDAAAPSAQINRPPPQTTT